MIGSNSSRTNHISLNLILRAALMNDGSGFKKIFSLPSVVVSEVLRTWSSALQYPVYRGIFRTLAKINDGAFRKNKITSYTSLHWHFLNMSISFQPIDESSVILPGFPNISITSEPNMLTSFYFLPNHHKSLHLQLIGLLLTWEQDTTKWRHNLMHH